MLLSKEEDLTLSEETAHSTVYVHLNELWAVFIQLDCMLRWWYTVEWAISSESAISWCKLFWRWDIVSICYISQKTRYSKQSCANNSLLIKVVLGGYHRCPDSHDLSECHHLYDCPSYKFNSLNFDSEKISVTTPWDHLKADSTWMYYSKVKHGNVKWLIIARCMLNPYMCLFVFVPPRILLVFICLYVRHK